MAKSTDNFSKGFIQIPNYIVNVLMFIEFTARQRRVIDLIIRLTFGCQSRWAKLRTKDFQIIKISTPHVKEVINPLLANQILLKNGNRSQYRLNDEYVRSDVTKVVIFELKYLRTLVGKQLLKNDYLNGDDNYSKLGKNLFPISKVSIVQNGTKKWLPHSELLNLHDQNFDQPKDNINIEKNKDKKVKTQKRDPYFFSPVNSTEQAALEAWNTLEPNKPDSFNFYLYAAKNGVPEYIFYEFVSAIKQDRTIKNKGAAFVRMVKSYLKSNDI